MRFSATSLALLVGTTLVSASSAASGGAAPDLTSRAASQPQNNMSERDLLERAASDHKFIRANRRRGHGQNGPRRVEAREHGRQPEARAIDAENDQLEKKDGLPLLVDAQLLGKPLAVVDGTVDLGKQGLKGVLGGLNLGGLLGKREKEHEKTLVAVDADLLHKNLADVDAKIDLTALNADKLKQLVDADINVNLARRTKEKRTNAPLIDINADLLHKSLADVQAAIDLKNLAKVNVDATIAAPAPAPNKAATPDTKSNALVDADAKVDALNAHQPLAVVDAKIDLNTEKLAKLADANLDVNVLHKRHEPSPEQTVVVDAALLDHPVVDAKIKLNEHLHNLKVGGITLATLKKRADQLALAVNEHLTGDHAYEDCGLGDVEDALNGLFAGVDAAVFRRKL